MAKLIIIGAGPCGLGAAWRLKELGFNDFEVIEALEQPGGLASSYIDDQGFTWDVGGHVQFSHYEDFDRVMDLALPDGWLEHERESWVWIKERFVPYPFQYNIWRLNTDDQEKCIKGIESLKTSLKPLNFKEWVEQSFGAGLSEIFMKPYNFKVWAHPLEMMGYEWIGERVATVDLESMKEGLKLKKDRVSWGPNSTFRFPKKGGTGAVWKSVQKIIGDEYFKLKTKLSSIHFSDKSLKLTDGRELKFDKLLSTIPLDKLMKLGNQKFEAKMCSSNAHIVGIGLKGKLPEQLKTKCWMYFPEDNCPFYRVTVFSNYSPNNVPDSENTWSLMCETSESVYKKVNPENIVEETLQGLLNTKLIQKTDEVLSKWHFVAQPGYPTPFLGRDEIVHRALGELEKSSIYSRGRFGLWKYEVSNQDHTFMQGFEWADWVISGAEQTTYCFPHVVNAPGKRPLR